MPAARRNLAKSRHQMLSTMMLMGINRIVITSGRIYARMGFQINAQDLAQAESASQFDARHESNVHFGGGIANFFGGPGGEATTSVAYVSSKKANSSDSIDVHADLTGEVDLKFKSDYFPMERFAKPELMSMIMGTRPTRGPTSRRRRTPGEPRRRVTPDERGIAMSEMPVVVLDPGHGGARGSRNRGSSWNRAEGPNGLLEKNVVYDLAQRVAARLRNRVRVELTRGADANPSLAERAEVRQLGARSFLSLHLNGSPMQGADGTDVYVAHDAGGAARAFADAVWNSLRAATGTTRGGVGVRDFGTIVTARHSPRTASCLAEIAYLTHRRQARAFTEEIYRDQIADALADAIRARLAPRPVAASLGVGDGSPFVADAVTRCWEKCEQLAPGASAATTPNVIAARRIRTETGATVDANPYAGISRRSRR